MTGASTRSSYSAADQHLQPFSCFNGTKLVNIVALDRAVGQVGDPAKEAAAATKCVR